MRRLSLETRRQIIRVTTILGVILTIVGSIYISRSPMFKPGGEFETLLRRMGVFAPVLFILVQTSQIIYPIIPLGLTNVIGDLIFGHLGGFLLNATGMIIGSGINFHLGRKYGEAFVRAFVSDSDFDRYIQKMNEGEGYRRLLKIGFIAPLFPDDIFCMISGMSDMAFKEFMGYVIKYRPASMFLYTYIVSNVIQFIYQYIHR